METLSFPSSDQLADRNLRMLRALTLASRAAHEAAVSLSFGLTHKELAQKPAIGVANEATLRRLDNGASVGPDTHKAQQEQAFRAHAASMNAHLQDFFLHAAMIQALLAQG